MDATARRHRDRAGTHPLALPGAGFLTARFVIRFDLPAPARPGPFYATRHPDPPHDWAMTDAHELARAVTFDTYTDAVHVLDFDYGRRSRRTVPAQGHHGRVVVLGEEIRGLSDLAAAALDGLRDEAAR